MKSMTGFAEKTFRQNNFSCTLLLKSLNHRYSEIKIYLPETLFSLEGEIRRFLQSRIHRGSLDCILKIRQDSSDFSSPLMRKSAQQYYRRLEQIAGFLHLKEPVRLEHLLTFYPEIVRSSEDAPSPPEIRDTLFKGLQECFQSFDQSRASEGEALQKELLSQEERLSALITSVRRKLPALLEKQEEDFRRRIREAEERSEEKFSSLEPGLFGFRPNNIEEEILRTQIHLKAFRNYCKEEHSGKKLEFLTQEIQRELNTLNAKIHDSEVQHQIIEGKDLLESIKEQLRNVE